MPLTLLDFIGKHEGETAWIFGKGPSLARFAMEDAGPLRCAINDVVRYIPACTYCFANDSVRDWADLYRPEHVLFSPNRLLNDEFLQPVVPGCALVRFDDDRTERPMVRSREQLAQSLQILPGTLGSAVQILALMGVRKIVAVGIDGGGTHAALSWRTALRADHAADYDSIRASFIGSARRYGIDLEFFGTPPGELTNGMKRILFIDATLVRGIHFDAGSIDDFQPEDAALIVGSGRGRYFSGDIPAPIVAPAPAAPVIETAALDRTVETAAKKPGRARKVGA